MNIKKKQEGIVDDKKKMIEELEQDIKNDPYAWDPELCPFCGIRMDRCECMYNYSTERRR